MKDLIEEFVETIFNGSDQDLVFLQECMGVDGYEYSDGILTLYDDIGGTMLACSVTIEEIKE